MSDIVKRLRACPGVRFAADPECNCAEAADEIERLTAERDYWRNTAKEESEAVEQRERRTRHAHI